jgi:DNA primase large subunit
MKPSEILKYYLNDEILTKLLNVRDRECAVRYGDSFGKRPMIFQYPEDVKRLIRSGATSFHVSEERWYNPLILKTEMRKEQFDSERKGWDLLLDIDCKLFDISKIFAGLITRFLKTEGLNNFSVKFSGGSGFHILIPYEAFPSTIAGTDINRMFPDTPMAVSIFMKNSLRDKLGESMKERFGIKSIAKMLSREEKELLSDDELDPYKVVELDTVLISERHLFRMQYSLNEKKWLASVPIRNGRLDEFSLEEAKPEAVDTKIDFFDVNPSKNEAEKLLRDAYEGKDMSLELGSIIKDTLEEIYKSRNVNAYSTSQYIERLEKIGYSKIVDITNRKPQEVVEDIVNSTDLGRRAAIMIIERSKKEAEKQNLIPKRVYVPSFRTAAVLSENIPPCIKAIEAGLADGRKRSVFILTNFYRSLGKTQDDVATLLYGWNKKNKPPLKEGYIRQQVAYAFRNKSYPPPNCEAEGYYKYFNVCFPNEVCRTIKNPLSYYTKLSNRPPNKSKDSASKRTQSSP